MQPAPWSYTRLADFKNCPRQFYEKHVAKSFVDEGSEASIWGNRVHTAFEERLKDGVVLSPELAQHEPAMQWLEQLPGTLSVEEDVALDTCGKPCGKWDANVWFRGVIDVLIVDEDEAFIRDWKTGKSHHDFTQLNLFAIHTFLAYPEVQRIRAEYYWTQTHSRSGATFERANMATLWKPFLNDLKQYAQAFQTDTWQPRQSGLCRGWCQVTDCEFWSPRRSK
jgi:hypothetical protein